MSSPRRLALIAALLCWACSFGSACSADRMRWLDSGRWASIVLIQELGAAGYQAEIYSTGEEALSLELSRSPRVVYALAYQRSIGPAGPLHVAEGGVPLRRPDQTLRLVAAQGSASEWSALEAPPEEIAALRFEELSPCKDIEQIPLLIPGTAGELPTVLLPLNDQEALLATDAGKFFVVRSSGVRPLALTSTIPHYAGARGSDGAIYLFDDLIGAVRGTLEEGFRPLPPRSFATFGQLLLAPAVAPAPLELFTVTRYQAVERFDGTRWTTLRAESEPLPDGYNLSIAWLEPGRAVVTGVEPVALSSRLLEIGHDGATRAFGVPRAVDGYRFHAVAALSTLGTERGALAGTNYGTLLERSGARWEEVPGERALARRVQHMLPLPGGALVGGQDRVFSQWFKGHTPDCPPITLTSSVTAHDFSVAAAVGPDLAGAVRGGAPGGPEQPVVVFWLRPLP